MLQRSNHVCSYCLALKNSESSKEKKHFSSFHVLGDTSLSLFRVGMHNRLSSSRTLCRATHRVILAGWRCGGTGLVIGAVQSLAGQQACLQLILGLL